MAYLPRKGRSGYSRLTASLAVFQALAIAIPGTTWAQTASSGYVDASTVGNLPGPGLNCDTFCAGVVDPTNQQDIGTSGADGWTNADDAYCANHGVSTNPNVQPNPTLTPNPNITCNVPVMPGDQTCSDANEGVLRCKVHGTQVETHCMAYQTDKGATSSEITLEEFDAAAAVTCMTACMVKTIGPFGAGFAVACSAAGTLASTMELVSVLSMQNSTQKAIYGFGAAAGLATSALTMARGIQNLEKVGVGTPGTDAVPGVGGKPGTPGTPGKSNTSRKDACLTAVAMAALAGYRGYNIYKQDNAKSKECTNIQNLLGTAGASLPGDGGGTTTSPGAVTTSSSGTSTTTSSGATTTSGGTGATSSSGSTIATVVVPTSNAVTATPNTATDSTLTTGSGGAPGLAGRAAPLSTIPTLAQAATAGGLDGSILNGSGLGQAVTPLAQQLASNPASATMASNGNAGGLIGSGFGSQGAAGAALADVARAAQAAAAAGTFPGGGPATYVATGGGPGAGNKPAEDENPFAKLAAGAAGGGGDGPGGAPSQLGFDKAPDPCIDGADIWHTDCRGTIFDVISGRINRSRSKVEALPWVERESE